MTVADVARETGYSKIFIREWIAQDPAHPFGICVRYPGSSKRTFKIRENAYKKWRAKNMTDTLWTVWPDDPEIRPMTFDNKKAAQDYADGLCCGYWIEEV